MTRGRDGKSHPVKSRFSEHRGETQDLTGETESLREGDAESQGGETQSLTSKENQSRKESVIRTKRIETKTHVEIAKSAIVDPPPLPDLPILWKTHCPSLPQIRETTQKRRDKIQIRLKEHPDPSWWVEVMTAIEKSAFCRGENRSGWRATFDWLIENQDNAIKVLEGKYSGANRSSSRGNFDFDVEKWAREG
ncbi:MAG: hypothetical protein M1313_00295 [Nitrospirae bacterium]|nr:hypothetical protein [Nitrospirota bacterium]